MESEGAMSAEWWVEKPPPSRRGSGWDLNEGTDQLRNLRKTVPGTGWVR